MTLLRRLSIFLLVLLTLSNVATAEDRLRLSTTTSTENSGLLKVLLPPFEQQHNCVIDVIAVGTVLNLERGRLQVPRNGAIASLQESA